MMQFVIMMLMNYCYTNQWSCCRIGTTLESMFKFLQFFYSMQLEVLVCFQSLLLILRHVEECNATLILQNHHLLHCDYNHVFNCLCLNFDNTFLVFWFFFYFFFTTFNPCGWQLAKTSYKMFWSIWSILIKFISITS